MAREGPKPPGVLLSRERKRLDLVPAAARQESGERALALCIHRHVPNSNGLASHDVQTRRSRDLRVGGGDRGDGHHGGLVAPRWRAVPRPWAAPFGCGRCRHRSHELRRADNGRGDDPRGEERAPVVFQQRQEHKAEGGQRCQGEAGHVALLPARELCPARCGRRRSVCCRTGRRLTGRGDQPLPRVRECRRGRRLVVPEDALHADGQSQRRAKAGAEAVVAGNPLGSGWISAGVEPAAKAHTCRKFIHSDGSFLHRAHLGTARKCAQGSLTDSGRRRPARTGTPRRSSPPG